MIIFKSKACEAKARFFFEDSKDAKAFNLKAFTGKLGSSVFHSGLVLVGLGLEKELDREALRQAAASAVYCSQKNKLASVLIELPKTTFSEKEVAGMFVEGLVLAEYSFDKYKTKKEAGVEVCMSIDAKKVRTNLAIAQATNYSRSLSNEPSSIATPEFMANEAKKLAGSKLKVSVLAGKDLEREKMGGIISVGQGSVHRPCLVVVEYNGGKGAPIALIGKGVCFDSGGISLKRPDDMDKMKHDKSGACAVLGVLKAASELSLPINIVAIMPFVENMPDGGSYKPGDIITVGGKSIEVLNTDAEGRLVLADALNYAKTFKPREIIDVATLTGACAVALGDVYAGLLSNNDALAVKLLAASEKAGDRAWRMPLAKEYEDKLKSDFADLKNIAESPYGGTSIGASFLKAFVGDVPWAHVDIAGVAWGKQKAYLSAGATGAGTRLLLYYLSGN